MNNRHKWNRYQSNLFSNSDQLNSMFYDEDCQKSIRKLDMQNDFLEKEKHKRLNKINSIADDEKVNQVYQNNREINKLKTQEDQSYKLQLHQELANYNQKQMGEKFLNNPADQNIYRQTSNKTRNFTQHSMSNENDQKTQHKTPRVSTNQKLPYLPNPKSPDRNPGNFKPYPGYAPVGPLNLYEKNNKMQNYNDLLTKQIEIQKMLQDLKQEEHEQLNREKINHEQILQSEYDKKHSKQNQNDKKIAYANYLQDQINERKRSDQRGQKVDTMMAGDYLPQPDKEEVWKTICPSKYEKRGLPKETKDLLNGRNLAFLNKGVIHGEQMETKDIYNQIKLLYDNHSTNYDIITGH